MSGVALAAESVEVRRGARAVLRVASLAVAPGEALAILGPNGAGKSTLLGVLGGIDVPAAGKATIGGEPATRLAARRRVALLPQDAPMLAGSVRENVALPLTLRGVAARERDARAMEMLDALGLAALATRDGRALSGGEARRVALARALVTQPEALLLDEPFSGVDGPARDRLIDDVRAAVRRAGITLVLVTQAREEALRLCGRLAILWDGTIRQDGPPEAVLSRPADPDVARFLGIENVVRGRVLDADGGTATIGIAGARIVGTASAPLAAGDEAWLIVSPDHVELRPASSGERPAGSPRNVLPATVRALDPREGRVNVVLDAGFPLVAAVTRAAVEELGLAPGARVLAVFKALACHLVAA